MPSIAVQFLRVLDADPGWITSFTRQFPSRFRLIRVGAATLAAKLAEYLRLETRHLDGLAYCASE